MSRILRQGVEDIIAGPSDILDQGIAEGSIAPLADTKSLAQSIYRQWLGTSLVAGLSKDDAPQREAMAATMQAVPAAYAPFSPLAPFFGREISD